jgi:hypothetical protein
MKYKIDEWALFCTFPEATGELLSSERERCLILATLEDDYFYDYKIIIEKTGKIKKVREHQLFPEPHSTY